MNTENYDRLLEHAFSILFHDSPHVFTYKHPVPVQSILKNRWEKEKTLIFKIHGSVENTEDIVLTETDYRELIYNSPGYRLVLSSIFLTNTVLFLGFSLSDPELRLILETHRDALKYLNAPDYILLSEDSAGPVERQRIREDFGVQVIPYTPSGGHKEILEFLTFLLELI